MDKEVYELSIVNKANYPIGYYIGLGGNELTAYPDTSLPLSNRFVFYNPNNPNEIKNIIYYVNKPWETIFKELPADTLSVFIFNRDTLLHYDWDTIRSQYKVLKRYDLSYHDLENMAWRINYP